MRIIIFTLSLLFSFPALAVDSIKVSDNIYMLVAEGVHGNIGISVGDDGVFMVDSKLAPLSDEIKASIAKISDKPVKALINTHLHYDHVGSNESFGSDGAIIVAHDNVRTKLKSEQYIKFFDKKTPALNKSGLPKVTFNKEMTLHYNNEEIIIKHLPNAHTDGDSVVYFKKANVLHMGDLFFNGMYPFIDSSNGGSVKGFIKAILMTIKSIDDKTKIIPGHGDLANKADLQTHYNMLVAITNNIEKLIGNGKSLKDVIAAKPTSKFDKKFGGGFINPESFITIIYNDLKK